jgi:hypothetical protein
VAAFDDDEVEPRDDAEVPISSSAFFSSTQANPRERNITELVLGLASVTGFGGRVGDTRAQ